MVDTSDSNSGAEKREGSNPSPRTCYCGMTEEDYMHDGWHRIHDWNKMVFEEKRLKDERQFDALLDQRKTGRRKTVPTVPTGDPTIWDN